MNILFISAVLPYPLYSGGQVRIYNILKILAKDHHITLCSFIRDEHERTYARDLAFLSDVHMIYRGRAMQIAYLTKMFGSYPLLLTTYDNALMKKCIEDELSNKKYDLIHLEPFYVYPSVPESRSIPMVVSEHNIEYAVYKDFAKSYEYFFARPILSFDAKKIHRWEEIVWRKASSIVAVSDKDAKIISEVTKKKTSVVANGVDIHSFSYRKHVWDNHNAKFVFVGNFAWAPNAEAVRTLLRDIWPDINERMPGATLTIVGKGFPNSLRQIVGDHVRIREDVADIRTVYQESDVLVAPMGIGGGSKFKILEAMASGTAVVTTMVGSAGIDMYAGKHFWQAETKESFVHEIEGIFAHPRETTVITKNARTLVEKRYSWEQIAKALDAVWKQSYETR